MQRGAKDLIIVLAVISVLIGGVYYYRKYDREVLPVEHLLTVQFTDPSLTRTVAMQLESHQRQHRYRAGLLLAAEDSAIVETTATMRFDLSPLIDSTSRYGDFIVGIIGWYPHGNDTMQFELMWSDDFPQIDSNVLARRVAEIPYHRFILRVPGLEEENLDVCFTKATSVDESLYMIHAVFSGCFDPNSGVPRERFYCSILVHYPQGTMLEYFINFALLILLTGILFLVKKRRTSLPTYLRLFKYGLMGTALVYLFLMLPGIFQVYNISCAGVRPLSYVLRGLVPDNAFFFLCGVLLLRRAREFKRRTLYILISIHLITFSFELAYNLIAILGDKSYFFLSSRWLRELLPQTFACASLCLIGLGLRMQGREWAEFDRGRAPLKYSYFIVPLSAVLIFYGIFQLGYILRDVFPLYFEAAFVIKGGAFGGVLLFAQLEVVAGRLRRVAHAKSLMKSERDRMLSLAAQVVAKSPQPIITFDRRGNIDLTSDSLRDLLILSENPKKVYGLLDDHVERQLVRDLVTMGKPRSELLLCLRRGDGERRTFLVDFIPLMNHGGSNHRFLLHARRLSRALYEKKISRIFVHGLKGDVVLIGNRFQLLLDLLDKLHGVQDFEKEIPAQELMRTLKKVIDELGKRESELERADEMFRNPNQADLLEVFKRLRELEERGKFPNIDVRYPEKLESTLIRTTPELAVELFQELLRNANAKFTKNRRGEVIIEKVEAGNQVEVSLEDNGRRIPEWTFEVMQDPGLEKFEETVKGLPSVATILRLFGGQLTMDNPERGDRVFPTFTLIFMRVRPDEITKEVTDHG